MTSDPNKGYTWKAGSSRGGGFAGYRTLEDAEASAQSYEEQGFDVTRSFDELTGLFMVSFQDKNRKSP